MKVGRSSTRRGRKNRAAVLSAMFAAVWLMTLGATAQARPLVEDPSGTEPRSASVSSQQGFSSQQLRAIRASSPEGGVVSNVSHGQDFSGPDLRATRASSPEGGSVWDTPGMYAAQIRALNDPDYGAPAVAAVVEAEEGFDLDSLGQALSVTLLTAVALAAGMWFVAQRRRTQHA
jgi:hypothetical protein